MKLKLTKQVISVLKKITPDNYRHLENSKSLKDFAPSIKYYGSCLVGEMRGYNSNYEKYNSKKGTPNCRSCSVIGQSLYRLAENEISITSFEYYLTALATHARLHIPKLPKIKNGFGKEKWF